MAPSARSLGHQPAAVGDQPGLRAVGTHSRGHTVCISKISTEPGGPENPRRPLGPRRRACEVPSLLLRGQLSASFEEAARTGPLRAGKGLKTHLGGAWLSGLLAPASPPAGTEEIFAGNSCSGCGGLEVYFRHAAAPSSLAPQPLLHPAPQLGFGPFPPKSTAEGGRGRVSRRAK